jgi:hypothetical protein
MRDAKDIARAAIEAISAEPPSNRLSRLGRPETDSRMV